MLRFLVILTAAVLIILTSSNPIIAAPVAVDDALYSTDEDTPINVPASGVLENDTDVIEVSVVNGDPLNVGVPTATANGTVTVNSNGSFTYTPNLNFNGADTFTYNASDGLIDSNAATVTITVNPANETPTDIALSKDNVAENQPVATVVGNFSSTDPDLGDTFAYTLVAGTGDTDNASFQIAAAQLQTNAVFDRETKSSYSIRVRTTDLGGLFFEEAFTITINNANETPTDIALSKDNVAENQPVATVVGNFSSTDPDLGDTFAYTLVAGTGDTDNASFNIVGYELRTSELFDYEAKNSYSVRVRTTDLGGLFYEEAFTISINNINEAPVGNADTGSTDENTALNVAAPGVLSNDTDPDAGDTPTVSAYAPTSSKGASVTVTANGSYSYDPGVSATLQALAAGTTTTDTFTYTIESAGGLTSTGTVTITVTGVNDAPAAVNDAGSTNEDTVLTVGAPGVLSNDTDVDTGDTRTVTAFSTTSSKGASVTVNANGSYSYDPRVSSTLQALAQGATTTDTFTYTITDSQGATSSATVTITVTGVNDVPVAVNDTGTTNEGAILNVVAPGLLSNDTDVEGQALSVVAGSLTTAKGALLTLNSNGSYTYNPNGKFEDLDNTESTTDTFNYTGTDGTATVTGTVTITITGINDAPVANFTANPTSGTAPPTGLVVSFTDTSTDIDNAITAWSWNFGDGTAPSTTQNTTHTYNQAGTFTVTLTVTDASGATNAKTGTVTVYAGISIGDLTGASSVPENVGNAVFTVSLTVPGANDVTVQYATANGTAKAAQDYTATSGTLTIAAGASSGTIAVPILNDTKVELTENFFVNLSSPSSNAIITGNQARCDIITDFIGRLRIDDVTVSENSGSATFTVRLDNQAEFDVSVDFATANNSATAGSDYTTTTGTLTIPANSTTGTIAVPILNDFVAEGTENFYVNLTNPNPPVVIAFSDNQGIGTINDNDYSITFTKAGSAASGYNVSLSAGSVSGAPGAASVVFGTAYGFDGADTVTLTATDTYPAAGCVFKGWSGSASGGAYTTTVTIGSSNKTVTATFNATHPFTIEDAGTGAGRASVTASAGTDPRFPGGTIAGPTSATFLYEQGSTITLTGTDNMPTAGVTGSQFENWALLYGTPGGGFNTANKSTSVTVTDPLSIRGSFIGKYMITSLARTGGTITPVGSTIKLHGQSQSYSMAANSGYVRSDTVIDGFSQGALASYTFNSLSNNHEIIAVFQSGSSVFVGQAAGDEQIYTASVPPMVLLTMGRDHKLYYEAYNDSSDLNGDGTLDVGYNPSIDYYGYFDSYKVYKYDSGNKRFYPVRTTSTKKVDPAVSDEWSGDFLNYLSMSRMDALRKVLYGGYRSTDTASLTVLERVYIPQDAHSWGKEYEGILRDGFDIREYTPLNLPADGTRHLFANTSLAADDHKPLLRVLNDSAYRIWEWVSIERPVAGTRCLDGGSGPVCVWAGGAGTMHPGHPGNKTQFQLLLARYGDPDITPTSAARANEFGRGPVTTINGTGNPFGDDDNYLTLFKGDIWIKTAGNYRFGVDGDDAVEVLVDGQVRTGDYGAHKLRGYDGMAKSGNIYMAAGKHTIEFRHEEGTNTGTPPGVDAYQLYWRVPGSTTYVIIPAATFSGLPEDLDNLTSGGLYNMYMYTWNLLIPRPASAMTDYEVRVVVADSSMPETNCKQYPAGNYKPIGLLQRFGEPGRLNFGLMTGSYEKNLSGGVLRKAIGSITNEITTSDGTFTAVNGIISTINKLRITGFNYGDYSYTPGWPDAWVTTRPINQGEMKDWGNPLAEMMFEGLRYYGGKKAYTTDFFVNSGVDSTLGLPYAATWDDPFVTNGACAKPFILAISDINPSYDSNQLPSVYSGFGGGLGSFTSNDSPPVALNVENEGLTIGTAEGIGGERYIGQVSTTVDTSCRPKTMNATDKHLGRTRGLCPEEPTKLGSYYSASVAYYGLTHDINPATSAQNVITYMVALASPLPKIEINVGGKMVTLVPFAKSVGGCLGITPDSTAFQPTNTIVDFYIESLTPTTGIFRVNYEDVEQGADHDMDAIVIYSYEVLDNDDNPVANPADGTQVRITLQSESASGCIIQHMGYIISGTTADGTYLEVVDADVDGSSNPTADVDYFLDTPPGATPGSGWNDVQPLPFVAERTFVAGATTSATLVENPLYYAAKWGGFVDQDDNQKPNLKSEWDSDDDGLPDTYFYVVNPLKLEQQLTRTFSDIVSRGVSHVAPVVSVDEANRTQSGDKLYMAFFKPLSDNYWQGNLKKYGLDFVARTECGRTLPEWTVTDANDNVAGLCDGTFKSSTQSFWSTEVDGAAVNKGGVGARLMARQSGTNPKTPATPYYSWRNVYTYKGATDGALVPFLHANITRDDLEVGTDSIRNRIINFMYGYTYDADGSGNPVSKREWILGDIIHSEPRIIDYLDDDGNLTHRFIAVGANDGMLHVFTDAAITIGGISYQEGDEIFAFIPRDLLRRLQEFSRADTHITMVDGAPALYRSNTTRSVSGIDHSVKTLVFGERAGGRSYWALDVTAPDPSTWKVKWQIEGGASGVTDFQELGYTWSKPIFTRMRTSSSTVKEVAIFAAGYDPLEDGFPEGFDDQNKNGKRDTGELHGVTLGGTEGYDKWNPSMDTMGRGIFVVDLSNGSLLFSATFGDDDGDGNEAEDVTTGINQRYAMMKYSFPADISVIPLSESLIIMYASDLYGQIWRIRYDYFADLGNDYTSSSSTKWRVKRIFTANPGSNLASGDAATFASNAQALDTTDAGRKMFYSPDVSLFGNDWTSRPVLYVGTGDRQHARYTMISNRMYFVSDTVPSSGSGTVADETDLLNLTCNELDDEATVAADTKIALRNILLNGTNSVRGFYRVLDEMGSCPDVADVVASNPTFFEGQHILSQPTLFFKNVYFTSYKPVFDDPCNPAGNAFIYALDFSFGASGFNYDFTNDTTETDVRTLKDTYRFISGSSIPSGVRVIMRDGHAAGLISAGGAVAGVGEDGSTTIPGPPGGITPLLWETE